MDIARQRSNLSMTRALCHAQEYCHTVERCHAERSEASTIRPLISSVSP
jgi:hypothetical protein